MNEVNELMNLLRFYMRRELAELARFTDFVMAHLFRALTLALMQGVMTEMEKPTRKAKISVVLTPRSHFYAYANLLTEYRRFVDEKTLDGGVTALEFEGIPVISIPNMASGRMYFLDEREWGYYVLENFRTDEKSTSTDSVRFIVVHYSQLVCKHPGRQASIDDLN